MTIKYYLHKSNLKSNKKADFPGLEIHKDTYIAIAQPQRTYQLDGIIEYMLNKGNLLTKTDILAVLNGFFETIEEITKQGAAFNTPVINSGFSIKGTFINPNGDYNPKNNQLMLNLNPGIKLKSHRKHCSY